MGRRDRLRGVESVMRPKSVAVLGASTKGHGSGHAALVNVLAAPYAIDVHVVHPYADQIAGVPAIDDVRLLPNEVDLALVSLPAGALLPALEQLASIGCTAAMVPSAGLDIDQSAALERFGRSSSMTIHGPNCMGVINVSDGFAPWFYDDTLTTQTKGPIAIVSQSGSAAFLTRAIEGIGFSKIVSTGNEVGLTTADYIAWLADDPETSTIGLVIESVRNVADFVDAIRLLREVGKRAVVLKVGRTDLGSAATTAHTGAIVGGDAGYASLFERLDLPLVTDYDELATALQCLAAPDMPSAGGTRVGVVTDSGGESGLAADLSTRAGVTLPAFDLTTTARLAAANPGVPIANPLDAGASPVEVEDSYETSYQSVVNDPNIDSLLVIFEAHGSLSPGEVAYAADHCRALRATRDSEPAKPVVAVSSSSIATHPTFRERLGPRVPLLRGICSGLVAARVLAGNQVPVPADADRPTELPDAARVAELRASLAAAIAATRTSLHASAATELLKSYGLPFVDSVVVTGEEQATAWADGRYPVAIKVASSDISHRSDIGAVVVDVDDADALTEAIELIDANVRTACPRARIDGYELQRMAPHDGVEGLLGFVADPVFGAVVSVGTGGTLVELEADVGSWVAPLSSAEAKTTIARTRLGARLDGYRNLLPATDCTGLADAMVSLSWLAHDMAGLIAACDLNPTIITPGTGAVTIVDVLVLLAGRDAGV